MQVSRLSLVTGATGFVGSAVVRALLAQGYPVRALVRKGSDQRNLAGLSLELVEGDLADQTALARAVSGCRYVFHIAADYRLWVPDPAEMMRTNVEGTKNVMEAALAAGVERVVHCSSVAALGLTEDGSPADETTPVKESVLIGPYKRSKYLAERAVLEMVRSRGLPAVIVNPSTPVGPRDLKPTPTGKMILDAAAGRMPGYLDTGLNIVHVDDVAFGHLLALERGRVGERYILGGENYALADLFKEIAEIAGVRPPFLKLSEPVLWPVALVCEGLAYLANIPPLVTRDHLRMARKRLFFSSEKAKAELGYAPRPARTALADAIAWFRTVGMLGPAKQAA